MSRSFASQSRGSNRRIKAVLIGAAVSVSGLCANWAHAANGTWTADSAGNWSDTTKWQGAVIADGIDAMADFSTVDITAARTVTVNTTSRTLGYMKIGDAGGTLFGYTMGNSGGGSLTLATSTGAPTIEIVTGSSTFSVIVQGNQGLTKTGGGGLVLNAANTLTGPLTVLNGTLRANNAGAFNGQAISVSNGAQAYHNAATTYTSTYSIQGDGVSEGDPGVTRLGAIRLAANGAILSNTITLTGDAGISSRSASAAGATISGQITGNFALRLGRTSTTASAGAGVLTLSNTSNNWGGDTTFEDGTVKNGAAGVIPNGAAAGNLTLKNGGVAIIAGIADTVWDLNGFDETINGLNSDAASDNTKIKIINNGANDATLSFGNANGTYRGSIINGTKNLSIMKIGGLTETLAGDNTYSGNTIIQSGTLSLLSSTSSNNIAASPMVIVGTGPGHAGALNLLGITTPGGFHVPSGQTITGLGIVNGAVTIDSGGTIAPGGNIGQIQFEGSLKINGALKIDINDADPNINDFLEGNGNAFNLTGATSTLDFDVVGTPTQSVYLLARYGSLTGAFANVIDLPAGYSIDYNYQGSNRIALVATVPEPVSLAMLGVGGLLMRRRRVK